MEGSAATHHLATSWTFTDRWPSSLANDRSLYFSLILYRAQNKKTLHEKYIGVFRPMPERNTPHGLPSLNIITIRPVLEHCHWPLAWQAFQARSCAFHLLPCFCLYQVRRRPDIPRKSLFFWSSQRSQSLVQKRNTFTKWWGALLWFDHLFYWSSIKRAGDLLQDDMDQLEHWPQVW